LEKRRRLQLAPTCSWEEGERSGSRWEEEEEGGQPWLPGRWLQVAGGWGGRRETKT
jgi:hypothetical protein